MTAQTYTLLVTITGWQPADLTALAQRIQHDLEAGTAAGAPHESATVDAFEGDRLEHKPGTVGASRWDRAGTGFAKRLHSDLRAGG